MQMNEEQKKRLEKRLDQSVSQLRDVVDQLRGATGLTWDQLKEALYGDPAGDPTIALDRGVTFTVGQLCDMWNILLHAGNDIERIFSLTGRTPLEKSQTAIPAAVVRGAEGTVGRSDGDEGFVEDRSHRWPWRAGTDDDLSAFLDAADGNVIVVTKREIGPDEWQSSFRELSDWEGQVVLEEKFLGGGLPNDGVAAGCDQSTNAMPITMVTTARNWDGPPGERPCMWRLLSVAEAEMVMDPKRIGSIDVAGSRLDANDSSLNDGCCERRPDDRNEEGYDPNRETAE
jgi:hypothetical protein